MARLPNSIHSITYNAHRVEVSTGDLARLLPGETFILVAAEIHVDAVDRDTASGRPLARQGATVTVTAVLAEDVELWVAGGAA